MQIRELTADEAPLLRELRLRALRDAPLEFGDSYLETCEQPDDFWLKTTESLTGNSRQRMFIAESDRRQIGSVFALGDASDPDGGSLGGMWVDSNQRRSGVGIGLTQTVIQWAIQLGLRRLRLWVADADTPAHRLYLRAGFHDSDERDASRSKIDKDLVRMILELPPGCQIDRTTVQSPLAHSNRLKRIA